MVTRDVIKLWWPKTSDGSMLYLGTSSWPCSSSSPSIGLWSLRLRSSRSSWHGCHGTRGNLHLRDGRFVLTGKERRKWGAICTVIYGTVMSAYGGYAVLVKKTIGMGTMEWYLIFGCAIFTSGVSFMTRTIRKDHEPPVPAQEIGSIEETQRGPFFWPLFLPFEPREKCEKVLSCVNKKLCSE